MRHYLQSIVDGIPLENLPASWQGFDFSRFSDNKTLFEFQQQGLRNALKALWLYFGNKDKEADKQRLLTRYVDNGFSEDFDYNLKRNEGKQAAKYLLDYDKDYPIEYDDYRPTVPSKIKFAQFINRMSFWMATGSGKTLIIVKLIELLGKLIATNELPTRDILFLAHREDLLDQFKRHVDEFNSFNFGTKIKLRSLREYDSVKRDNPLPFAKNELMVFYYRSDLIDDEHKEKQVNYRNYDNNGRWYILLDEAHKGHPQDSKRQILYSILSRNGFLFNFSATFTDDRDRATCVFNFNLSPFVSDGYGKHLYVSAGDVSAFREQDDFSPVQKQKVVLKTLLLLTYINKHLEKVRAVDSSLYHRPLLLTLVDSVNVEKSDLELFFKELEKVANNEIRTGLLTEAKDELVDEFSGKPKFEFEGLQCELDTGLISTLGYGDILKHVLNADKPGKFEVLKIPGNRSEVVFRLMTSEKPFALIKIGNIDSWLKDKLEGYEISVSFDHESYFRNINRHDSDINILMGSRSFYEGWDSNRPNLLLFVNIGVSKDAKKFVLQSVGRAVRIEPVRHQRRRLLSLYNAKIVDEQLFEQVKDLILPIESSFVFGTNAANLKEIISKLKEAEQVRSLDDAFIVNPKAQNRTLLVPVYKTADKILAEESTLQQYTASREDVDATAQFCEFIGDKVAVARYDCDVKVLKKAKESFADKAKYYSYDARSSLGEPELTLGRIFDYFGIVGKEFDEFKKLENEIVHFRKVKFSGDGAKYEELRQKIKELPAIQEALDKGYGKLSREEFAKQTLLFEQARSFELNNQKIGIKRLANHYYLPVIVSESEKIDYLNHIINVKSEVDFVRDLELYFTEEDSVFKRFDWWMFSKLDHTLDEVSIPYYNPTTNSIANFNPDFIFWAQKGKDYLVLFVDPKGTEHANAYRKIDGYSKMFEVGEPKQSRKFSYGNLTIQTKLLLKPKQGIATVPENYRQYWFDNLADFASKIS